MKKVRKYPYYSENSSLEGRLQVVTTVAGDTEYRSNCISYPEGFLVKDKDLVFMEDIMKWVKKTNLVFNHTTKSYVRSKDNLSKGIVGISSSGSIEQGWYEQNPFTSCTIHMQGSSYRCMDYKLVKDNPFFIEEYSTGIFHEVSGMSDANIKKMKQKKLSTNSNSQVYNIVDDMSLFELKMKMFAENNFPIDSDLLYAGRRLGDLTYGVEIETINGTLPEYLANQYGIVTCRDGSIRTSDGVYPPEYVTVPYSGSKGLQAIRNITKEIALRSAISEKCSLHIHIGNFDKSRMFMISLYNLCMKVQEDIFDMFPYYKRNEVKYAGKEKNYSQKLPSLFRPFKEGNFNNYINDSYEALYGFITKNSFSNTNNVVSKRNPFGSNKWNIPTRYYWVNFTNIFFGKQDTIEFRIHTPTTNSDKITNWLFIISALVKYATANPEKCMGKEKISLRDDVLSVYNEKNSAYSKALSEKLKAYYDNRKEYFAADAKKEDYMSKAEMKQDETFEFNITKI